MALTVQNDPDASSFNAYVSLAEFNTYHEGRGFNSIVSTSTSAEKNAAIVWATRMLDTLQWSGVRTVGSQDREFPRKGLSYTESTDVYIDSELYDGGLGYYTVVTISSTTVPQQVKDAVSELGMYLLDSDSTAPTGTEGFKRIEVDVIKLEIDSTDRQPWFTDSVRRLVWRFLKNQSKFNTTARRVG